MFILVLSLRRSNEPQQSKIIDPGLIYASTWETRLGQGFANVDLS